MSCFSFSVRLLKFWKSAINLRCFVFRSSPASSTCVFSSEIFSASCSTQVSSSEIGVSSLMLSARLDSLFSWFVIFLIASNQLKCIVQIFTDIFYYRGYFSVFHTRRSDDTDLADQLAVHMVGSRNQAAIGDDVGTVFIADS